MWEGVDVVDNIWKFLGIQRTERTESDKLLSEILSNALTRLFRSTGLSPSEFSSLSEMVEFGRQLDNEYSYFWDWMKEYGIGYLNKIGKASLPDTEDTQEFLEYRKFILEMDIESGIVSNLFISVAELLKAVDEFINSYKELAASVENYEMEYSDETIFFNDNFCIHQENFVWNLTLDSAPNQQSFLMQ